MTLSNENPSHIKQQEEDILDLIERNPHIFAQFERLLNLLFDLNIITPITKQSSKLNNGNGKTRVSSDQIQNLPRESTSSLITSQPSIKEKKSDMHNLENSFLNTDKQLHNIINEKTESSKQLSPDAPILEQTEDLKRGMLSQLNSDNEPQVPCLQSEQCSKASIQEPESLEQAPDTSATSLIQDTESLEETVEPSFTYSSEENNQTLEQTTKTSVERSIQDNLEKTQDLENNNSQTVSLASELHRLLSAGEEYSNDSSQDEHNLEQIEDLSASNFDAVNITKPPLAIQQDRVLIIENKIINIEHLIEEVLQDKSHEVMLSSIEDKIAILEHGFYELRELINLIMPAIADTINNKLSDSNKAIVGHIAPIIDASIHNKSKQDIAVMQETIASAITLAISREMDAYRQEIAATIDKQINLEKEAIANALVPVIENTIAKYMAKSENAFSFNAFVGNIRAKIQGVQVNSHPNEAASRRQKRPSLRLGVLFFLSLFFLPLGFLWYRKGIERRIEATTTKALESAPELSMYRIGVDANGGILRLSGKVPSQNVRQKAEKIAKKAASGLKLDNDIIIVELPVDPAVTAAEVKRVTSILNKTNSFAIKAKYAAGNVTIEGTVNRDANIKNIAQAIKQIPGVKSVNNNLHIESNAIATRIYFAPGSAKLNRGDINNKIILIKNFLERYPQENLRIIGNTDANSNQAKYQRLALKRAESVRDALVNQGVDAKRVQVTTKTNRPGGVDVNQPAGLSRSVEFEAIAPSVKTKQSSEK